MNELLIGSKSDLAIECVINDSALFHGKFFLYIHGKRFGQDNFDEDLKGFVDRLLISLDTNVKDYDELYAMDCMGLYRYMDCLWGEIEDNLCQDYSGLNYDLEELDRNIIIRAGYALDRHLIVLVRSKNKEKLNVVKKDDETYESVVLKKGELLRMVRELNDEFDRLESV